VVHLLSISGFRNKFLVGFNWAISYFTYEKSNRVIIRSFKRDAYMKASLKYSSNNEWEKDVNPKKSSIDA